MLPRFLQSRTLRKISMEREDIRSIIESLLFVADGPLTIQRLGEVLEGAEKEHVRSILDELQAELENSRRGVRLVEVAGGYQLRTAEVNGGWGKKFLGGRAGARGGSHSRDLGDHCLSTTHHSSGNRGHPWCGCGRCH